VASRKNIIQRMPRSATALVWALAALHWRSGKKFAGATHAGLSALLGTEHRSAIGRAVEKARKAGVIVVLEGRDERNHHRRLVVLTHSTLLELEDLWVKS
jgi:hypothetical protein